MHEYSPPVGMRVGVDVVESEPDEGSASEAAIGGIQGRGVVSGGRRWPLASVKGVSIAWLLIEEGVFDLLMHWLIHRRI